jgi:hypothetical protein
MRGTRVMACFPLVAGYENHMAGFGPCDVAAELFSNGSKLQAEN